MVAGDAQKDTTKGGKGTEQIGLDSDGGLDTADVRGDGKIYSAAWHG